MNNDFLDNDESGVVEVLAGTPMFQGLSREALCEVRKALTWVHINGGEALDVKPEDGSEPSLYVVIHGRLALLAGEGEATGEVGRGECFGEAAILAAEPWRTRAVAMRDSDLVRIPGAKFLELAERYPLLMRRVAAVLAQRLQEARGGRSGRRAQTTVAVVPADESVPVSLFTKRLVEALSTRGPVLHLDSAGVDGVWGSGASRVTREDARSLKIYRWLSQQEEVFDYVVFEAQASASAWTERCVRQAGRILVVGAAGTRKGQWEPGEAWRMVNAGVRGGRKELVLLHGPGETQPAGTGRWLARGDFVGHYHVRPDRTEDYRRLARFLSGRAVGLVLSGGAARGFAHLGVIRALREQGMPVDCIGGTSIGAVVGAQCAMGLDDAQLLELNEKGWSEAKFTRDFTLPLVSLLTASRMNRMLKRMFGEVEIEDLRTPYFCTSSNLTRARVEVHRSGLLWRWLRASTAVPGIGPPLVFGGDMYADGAILNNMPTDAMRDVCNGVVVASDASLAFDLGTDAPDLEAVSGWRVLLDRIRPGRNTGSIPSILHILIRAAELSSVRHTEPLRRDADLYLRLPVAQFRRFDWRAVRRIAQAGYEYAAPRVEEWLNSRG